MQKTITEEEVMKLKSYAGKEVSVHLHAITTYWNYGEPTHEGDDFFCTVQIVDVVKNAITWDVIDGHNKKRKRLEVPFYYKHELPWEVFRRYIEEITHENEIIYNSQQRPVF